MSNFIGTFVKNSPLSQNLKAPLKNGIDEGDIVYTQSINTSKSGAFRILFDGELHNLEGSKAQKAEQILSDYLKLGVESFKALDGEFTFIILSEEETLIYRDRHGAGAQVYYNDKFYTSFLRNFITIKDFSAEPNMEAIHTFLSIGYVPSPMASLKNVHKLPAGNVLIVKNGEQKLQSLFTWNDFKEACLNPQNISVDDATAKYEELHKLAINQRVKGKKKVGLLLSGGYDSGGNIAGLRDVYTGDAFSYSIGFKDNPWTELPLAKILSERFGTQHTEYEIDGSEILDLPDLVETLGDPFQEGGLMVNYAVMKLIGADKPDIILGGDGNDQHFGTAGKELALNYSFQKKGYTIGQKIWSGLGGLDLFNKDNLLFRTQFHNEKILNIQKSDNFGFKAHDLKKLCVAQHNFGPHKYLETVPRKFKSFDEFYFVHNYFGDIKQVINEVILFKASKMADMFGNNLSFPYMSTDIYDFLKTLPRELKCKGTLKDLSNGKGVSKFLHKNYLKPKLPTEITDRKKQGGFAPLPIFFKNNKQRRKLEDFILNSDAAKQLFSQKYLTHFFSAYDENVESGGYWFWYKQVKAFQFFNLLVVSVWWELFINQKSSSDLKTELC